MIYWQLFLSFLQIGMFSFGGGYAALPLIQEQVVTQHGWLLRSEFTDLITISQMTPGPIAVNSATFVGIRLAGFLGALAATFGCILPSCILVTVLSYLYLKYRKMSMLQGVLETLEIDPVNRCVAATVAFPSLVEREALYDAEKRVAMAPGLQLTRASLHPKFPPESFCAGYLPSLVLEMKRRDASINGTFSDATARLEEGKIIVTLAHGGADLMRQRRADRLMSRIIAEEFGLTIAVDFDGVTERAGVFTEKLRAIRR